MATPRSIVDVLAEQSEESLREMRDAAKAELSRVAVEIEQIEEALARKTRKRRTGGGKLSREQVFEVVRAHGRAMTAAEVRDFLSEVGSTATLNAVRNHLNRLVDDDARMTRHDGGLFGIPLIAEPEGSDDDIPF